MAAELDKPAALPTLFIRSHIVGSRDGTFCCLFKILFIKSVSCCVLGLALERCCCLLADCCVDYSPARPLAFFRWTLVGKASNARLGVVILMLWFDE